MKQMKSPQDMMAAMSDSMKERTGKSLDDWVALVLDSDIDPLDQKAVRHWLKTEHGVLQNSQWAIADAAARAAGWVRPSQFAAIQASTRTRVDLGLRFTEAPPSALLNASNPPGQCTHKIALQSVEDITSELIELITLAYTQNG